MYLDECFGPGTKNPDDDCSFVCLVENLICLLNADFQHGEEMEILTKQLCNNFRKNFKFVV